MSTAFAPLLGELLLLDELLLQAATARAITAKAAIAVVRLIVFLSLIRRRRAVTVATQAEARQQSTRIPASAARSRMNRPRSLHHYRNHNQAPDRPESKCLTRSLFIRFGCGESAAREW